MKSLLFRYKREELLARTKRRTIRWLMCPNFIINDVLVAVYCSIKEKCTPENKESLYFIKITEIRPIQGKDIDDKLAKEDGFRNKEECIVGQMEINGIKDRDRFMERWGFTYAWEEIELTPAEKKEYGFNPRRYKRKQLEHQVKLTALFRTKPEAGHQTRDYNTTDECLGCGKKKDNVSPNTQYCFECDNPPEEDEVIKGKQVGYYKSTSRCMTCGKKKNNISGGTGSCYECDEKEMDDAPELVEALARGEMIAAKKSTKKSKKKAKKAPKKKRKKKSTLI